MKGLFINQSRTTGEFTRRDEYGNFEVNLRFVEEIAPVDKQAKVLEIGCGKGRLLAYLYRNGYDVHGIEIDESMINYSRRLYGDLPITKMSGDNLLFNDGSFDVVLSFDVFEHIQNSDAHLQEVNRVLRPGGYYLLQTPNKWTNVIFESIRWRSISKWRREHCSLHTYWQLKRRFNKNGFDIEFYDLPIVNDFFKTKIKSYLGGVGLFLIRLVNPDRLPSPFRTNYYISARKRINCVQL